MGGGEAEFFHLWTASGLVSDSHGNVWCNKLHRTELSGNTQLAVGRNELQPHDEGTDHLFRQEGHSTRHCKWQRAKSLDALFHASEAPYYILTVSGAKPRGIKMAISEINKTLAAALQSARALSNQTLVRPKEAAAMLGISRKHLYALADQPNFPKRIHVSDRVVAWRVADIEAWIDAKAQGGV